MHITIAADGISCAGVNCPALPYAGCEGVTPWDSCCPKCGMYMYIVLLLNYRGECVNAK